ncbi:hypothetical protein BDV27DRAFT_137507 [Aspergillus caelatus]|uniref:Uncharacterized protein n=1 Tax=Aspergillus caelatus TaxID=61420 RepID=A0A5N6ZMW9_9EURO|nr:uncharacterized protein BDV27DRAFT_137507 [Aspergillus caelatus]KAE8358563.1 hypothetical protein BDV27DRAFT_137507 [Aspergillus caelatus]
MIQESYQSSGSNGDRIYEFSAHDNWQGRPTTNPHSPASTAEYVDYYRGFLNQLLDLLQSEDQPAIDRVISLIRSGASQEEVFATIQSINN